MTLALDLHLTHHHSSAEFSADRRYRYELVRRWNDHLPPLAVVGHNPSDAGEYRNDPTVRRLIGFAKSFGRGSLILTNLSAGVATDPKDLAKMSDPIGPDNDEHLQRLAEAYDLIVLAWGANADPQRARAVASRLWRILCRTGGALAAFGWTANNQPRHPLYLPRTCTLQCLTAGAHPDYVDVDGRWTQLIADTTDVDPISNRLCTTRTRHAQ